MSVEEVIFRCGNHSTSKSVVYVHTQTDVHSLFIYVFDEKNHIIAFGTYNVTYLHGLFSNLGQKVLHRCSCLYWCG